MPGSKEPHTISYVTNSEDLLPLLNTEVVVGVTIDTTRGVTMVTASTSTPPSNNNTTVAVDVGEGAATITTRYVS